MLTGANGFEPGTALSSLRQADNGGQKFDAWFGHRSLLCIPESFATWPFREPTRTCAPQSAGGFANALIGVGSDSMGRISRPDAEGFMWCRRALLVVAVVQARAVTPGRITTIFMCILMCDFAVTGFGMVRSKLALLGI